MTAAVIAGSAEGVSVVWGVSPDSAGFSYSYDNGKIWTNQSTPLDRATLYGTPRGTWLASRLLQNGYIYRSINNGQNWGVPYYTGVASPIVVITSDGNNNWFITYDSGAGRYSSDDGLTWSTSSSSVGSLDVRGNVVTDGSGTWVGVGAGGNMFRSTDNCANWTLISNSHSSYIRNISTDLNGNWVACGDNGEISRSTDDGVTWGSLLSTSFTTDISALTYSNGTFIASDSSNGVYISTDQGATWARGSTPFSTSLTRIVAGTGSNVVGVTSAATAYYSSNSGNSWTVATTSPTSGTINQTFGQQLSNNARHH